MRLLFILDKKDYENCTHTFVRNSARSIIIENQKIAMLHSRGYGYYALPGGGIEEGETPAEAMIRETREEAGLVVLPDSVREYGYVRRIQKSDLHETECYLQNNFYYLCKAAGEILSPKWEDYEAKEDYHLEYVDPAYAIRENRRVAESPHFRRMMLEREIRVLELLIAEGMFEDPRRDT